MPWIRRRQQRKTALRAARMFVALEGLSNGRRRTRTAIRASLGASR
jgi:hypothetical protein